MYTECGSYAARSLFYRLIIINSEPPPPIIPISPAASPVTLDAMKLYLKITSTADDVLIQTMIDAATVWGEKYTGRDFRFKVWEALLDCFYEPIELRRSPITSIDSITYIDENDVEQTVSPSVYYLTQHTFWSQVWLQPGESWPDDVNERQQSITVRFETEAYYCINEIMEAIMRTVAYWYINRGDCSDCKCAATNSGVTAIYDQFRIPRI